MRRARRLELLSALCLLLLGFVWLDPFGPQGLAWLREHRDQMIAWREARFAVTAFAYLALSVLSIGLLLPTAAAMMVLAGVVFGFGWGVVLAVLGFSMGALMAFGLSRTVLRSPLRTLFGSRLDGLERQIRAGRLVSA